MRRIKRLSFSVMNDKSDCRSVEVTVFCAGGFFLLFPAALLVCPPPGYNHKWHLFTSAARKFVLERFGKKQDYFLWLMMLFFSAHRIIKRSPSLIRTAKICLFFLLPFHRMTDSGCCLKLGVIFSLCAGICAGFRLWLVRVVCVVWLGGWV